MEREEGSVEKQLMTSSKEHEMRNLLIVCTISALMANPVSGSILGVTGPSSSLGTAPAIIPAPSDILDDFVVNTGMQGFDEAQGVTTTLAYATDTGTIPIGTVVDSHMIFLNSGGRQRITHRGVTWVFDRNIIGVMSDRRGILEATSTPALGAPGTNYTNPFAGSGPAPPFRARGLERNDSYTVFGNSITVNMRVTEPGDWIRVVTAGPVVPEPSSVAIWSLIGVVGIVVGWRQRRLKK